MTTASATKKNASASASAAATAASPSSREQSEPSGGRLGFFSFVMLVVGIACGVMGVALTREAPTASGLVALRGPVWTAMEAMLPLPVFSAVWQAASRAAGIVHQRPSGSAPAAAVATPPFHALSGIWSDAELSALDELVASIGSFPSFAADQTSMHEHIGEGVPPREDGSCPHAFLVPNRDRSLCTLANRIDVGVHYLKSGGPSGIKETQDALVARTLSFSKFFITNPLGDNSSTGGSAKQQGLAALNSKPLQALFSSSHYLRAAKSVCAGLEVVDPFQLGVILQLPGQQLGVHLDVPWFFGANRFHFPQWLLVVMAESGLWKARAVRQVQGVAYLHSWDRLSADESDAEFGARNGGDFLFWPDGAAANSTVPLAHPPRRNSAIMLDGSLIPHGTAMFRPNERHTLPVEKLRRGAPTALQFEPAAATSTPAAAAAAAGGSKGTAGGRWTLTVDGAPVQQYSPEQVRISLVWRAMCFASEADRDRYHSSDAAVNPPLALGDVLETLRSDLVRRGKMAPDEQMEPLHFAQLLLATYVDYPWPAQRMPFNYCIVPGAVGDAIRRVAC